MPTALLDQRPVPLFVDGRARETTKTFDLVDPHDASGKVVYQVCAADESDCDAAVDSAWAAFSSWSQTSYETRRNICLKAAAIIRQRQQELVAIETGETVSSPAWANFCIGYLTVQGLEETAAAISREIAPTKNPAQHAHVVRMPYGVVLGMAPWNATATGMRAVRDALMAGNTVILKTSEFSPRSHLSLASVLEEAGLPSGVLQVLHIATADAPRLVERIIARKEVRKVNFTGSTAVGAKIAEVCGRHLKPSVMELGGKAPFIVLPDANLELAANAAVFGGLDHAGQVCMSTDILIVHEDVAKPFAEALKREFTTVNASSDGDWLRGLFTKRSVERLDGFVEDAVKKGAEVVAGKRDRQHNVMQPLVLGGITNDMQLATEEAFGPLLSMRTFKTDEEAIKLANYSDFGLSSSVYGADVMRAMRLANRIETGAVHINGMTIHDEGPLPHGGCKKAGWGRFNSVAGLHEFTYSKVITIEAEPFKYRQ